MTDRRANPRAVPKTRADWWVEFASILGLAACVIAAGWCVLGLVDLWKGAL